MVYFSFVCLLKLILYSSRPKNQKCDRNQKCFCFAKILNQAFLHYSHIWLRGFFTFLVALAHGVPWGFPSGRQSTETWRFKPFRLCTLLRNPHGGFLGVSWCNNFDVSPFFSFKFRQRRKLCLLQSMTNRSKLIEIKLSKNRECNNLSSDIIFHSQFLKP